MLLSSNVDTTKLRMAQSSQEQSMLPGQCALLIESRLLKHYPELAKFAKVAEPAAVDSDEPRTGQVRGLHGSSRSARTQPPPMEPMEPIAEEKSELAMDIAQAVVEKLDIDRKLDERMKELMMRGDRIFRDIQVRQEQSTEALCRSVSLCLESQRAFQEEHQRLLAAVKDLATMVIPYTPLGTQALEHKQAHQALMEETEALKKQMEEDHSHRLAAACAAAAAIAPSSTPASPTSAGSATFSITLRKADEVSLGLNVNSDENDEALVVEGVRPGGAVDSWNRQCYGDGTGERVVMPGDRIVRVNGIEGDVKKMLEECTKQRLVKLVISHGPASPYAQTPTKSDNTTQQAIELTPPAPISAMRKRAPEFVPSGVDAPPLQQTQHLAVPPGLFFPRPEDYTKKCGSDIKSKMDAHAVVAGVVSHGIGEELGIQEVNVDGEDSDKEN